MAQDPVTDRLKRAPIPDRVRADAWDAFDQAVDADDLAQRLSRLSMPDAVKADLWDLKAGQPIAAPKEKPPAAPKVPGLATLGAVAAEKPGGLGAFFSKVGERLNPITAAQSFGKMIIPEDAARLMGADSAEAEQYGPLNTLRNMGQATQQVFEQAKEAYDKGDYGSAAIKALFGSMPMVGPDFNQMGDKMREGQYAEALGEATGLGASIVAPAVVGKVTARVGKVLPSAKTPAESAAVQFGRERGVPIDAGTATGNRYVKSAQGLADHSPIGSVVAERAKVTQGRELARVAGELKDDVLPKPMTAVGAGESVSRALAGKIKQHHGEASAAYEKLRQFEQAAPDEVVAVKSAAVPSDPNLLDQRFVLRWLADDLNDMPYQASSRMRGQQAIDTMTEATSQEAGRRAVYSPRVAGSPVQDTLNLAGVSGTKAELAERINKALQTGKVDKKLGAVADAYREAWDGQGFDFDLVSPETLAKAGVMRKAMKSPITMPDVTEPGASRFFPDSSIPEAPKATATATQKFAVDLRQSKQALAPIYDRLKRESELVPLQGGKARALTALDRLMAGPDSAPLSVVDEALGDLKALARTDDLPELRTQGQGVAAQAVKQLDAQVRARAAQAGPEVLQALEDGRMATVAKYLTADARDLIGASAEPRSIFNRLTANEDAGLAKLRELKIMTPDEIPNVARGLLDDILEKPTSEGGFQGAARAHADWQRIGADTKKLLFTKPGQVEALDSFFLLAKKIGESPNPSQSGLIANAAGQTVLAVTNPATGIPIILGTGALSKLLHSPKAVQFLTTGLRMSINAKPAAQAAAVAQIGRAAQEAGVVIPFPKAAEASPERKR